MASRKGILRGLAVLAAILVAAAAGYSYVWHRLADRLEAEAKASLAALNRGAVRTECENAEANGYPLRLGLSCTGFNYADGDRGISVETGAFRSTARLYAPRDIEGAVSSPALVTVPDMPPLHVIWRRLGAETRLASPLPEHVAVSGRAIAVSPATGGAPLARMAAARLRAAPAGRDLRLALRFDGLALDESLRAGLALPPLDGEARLVLADGIALLADPPENLRGVSAKLDRVTLSSGEAGITVSGPIAVGPDGLVSAELAVTVRRPHEVSALLARALPAMRKEIDAAFSGLAMFGDEPTVPLRIERGKAFVGFIPLGRVPRL